MWQNLAEEKVAAREEGEDILDFDADISVDDSDNDNDFVPFSDTDDSDDPAEMPEKIKKAKRSAKGRVGDRGKGKARPNVGVLPSVGVKPSAGGDDDNASVRVMSQKRKRQSGEGTVSVHEDDGAGPSGVGDDGAGPSGVGDDVGLVVSTPRHSPRRTPSGVVSGGSGASSGGPGGSNQPGKKKVRQVTDWQVSKAKRARNLGKEYKSYKTKKVMPARKVGEPCKDGCFGKLGRDKIDEIFNNFWALGDVNLGNNYLVNCMKTEK